MLSLELSTLSIASSFSREPYNLNILIFLTLGKDFFHNLA